MSQHQIHQHLKDHTKPSPDDDASGALTRVALFYELEARSMDCPHTKWAYNSVSNKLASLAKKYEIFEQAITSRDDPHAS